ncbi:hypothetical protein N9J91_03680 [Gammaproteobacteria bacterium]|nr:hypothetical protein [Gammaproteobacteria bacterium]
MINFANKKNILICVTNGWAVRNLIHTGLVDNLVKNYQVSISTTPRLYKYFTSLKEENIINNVYIIPANENIFWTRLRQLKKLMLQGKYRVSTASIKSENSAPSNFMALIMGMLWKLISYFCSNNIIYTIEKFEKIFRSRVLSDDEKLIDLLILGEPFDPRELQMQRSFDKYGIPSISIIQSWDNTSTKGRILSCASKILVWGEAQKNEIINFYPEYNHKNIISTGLSQFDNYRDRKKRTVDDRSKFLRELNIPLDRKIILFATGANKIGGQNEPQICNFLANELDNNLKNRNCHLIIRLHQADSISNYNNLNLIGNSRITICTSSVKDDQKLQDWLPPANEITNLADFLAFSDVCLNTASTMTLDSMAMGTPVVNIGFEIPPTHPRLSSSRYYKYHHWKPLIELNALSIAYKSSDLVSMIKSALDKNLSKENQIDLVLKKVCNIGESSSVSLIENAIHAELNN